MGRTNEIRNGINTLEQSLYRNQELLSPVEVQGDFLKYFERSAAQRSMVMIQGPRTFLWPQGRGGYYQDWQYHPLTAGWDASNSIADSITASTVKAKVAHYGMIDDMENRPHDIDQESISSQMYSLKNSSLSLSMSPLFMNGYGDHPPVTVIPESSLVSKEGESSHVKRSGDFHMKKIRSQLKECGNPDGIRLQDAGSLLMVNIVPLGFERQQEIVLEMLLGAMRADPIFVSIRKVARRQLIEHIFRYVWVNGRGRVDSVTKPKWDTEKFRFNHEPVQL